MDYFVTWHTVITSEQGLVCKYPKIIQHSLKHIFGELQKMKIEYGVVIYVGLLASVSLGLISIQPHEIPHWNYLHEMKQQEFQDGL